MTDHFQDKAADWDARDTVRELSRAVGAAILERAPLAAGQRVLDFGAGTGLIAAQVAARVERVTAVDVSRAMLDALLAKPELEGKVEAVCQDILEAPLGRSFDGIVSAMAMHHVEDTGRMIRSFADHLAPGGFVALADLDLEDGTFHPADVEGVFHQGFDRAALGATLEASGFVDVDFATAHTVEKEGGSYPVFLVLARKAS
ncbi:MAG: class I SAM-dependent methyltransferase [Deltaproteobacteria bacterium]|nr:class I SAM-dependent methyltransferase [Deltaproteobacteria bacterium]